MAGQECPGTLRANRFAQFFEDSTRAYLAVALLLAALCGSYIAVHLFREMPGKPWSGSVAFASDGTFEPEYDHPKLEKFFSREQIDSLRSATDAEAEGARAKALTARRRLLLRIDAHLRTVPRQADETDRGVDFGKASQPVSPASEVRIPWNGLKLSEQDDRFFLQEDLSKLALWLEDHAKRSRQADRATATALVEAVKEQERQEQEKRDALARSAERLEPQLTFLWLYHEGAGWLFEVTVWSLLGVLASTMIGLIASARSNGYDACQFSLVFPKLLIAPLISVVSIALISAGITEQEVNLNNLPLFLVLSFFLGFNTESLYGKLRAAGEVLLTNPLKVNEQKLLAASRADRYLPRNPLVTPGSMPRPSTFPQFTSQAKRAARGSFEASIVTSLARHGEKSQ